MDELLAGIFHWEGFVGSALEGIADVADNAIEEDQVEIALKIFIGKFIGFFFALDL